MFDRHVFHADSSQTVEIVVGACDICLFTGVLGLRSSTSTLSTRRRRRWSSTAAWRSPAEPSTSTSRWREAAEVAVAVVVVVVADAEVVAAGVASMIAGAAAVDVVDSEVC